MIVRALKMQVTPPVVLAEYESEVVPRLGEVLTIKDQPFAVRGVIHNAAAPRTVHLMVERLGEGSPDNVE